MRMNTATAIVALATVCMAKVGLMGAGLLGAGLLGASILAAGPAGAAAVAGGNTGALASTSIRTTYNGLNATFPVIPGGFYESMVDSFNDMLLLAPAPADRTSDIRAVSQSLADYVVTEQALLGGLAADWAGGAHTAVDAAASQATSGATALRGQAVTTAGSFLTSADPAANALASGLAGVSQATGDSLADLSRGARADIDAAIGAFTALAAPSAADVAALRTQIEGRLQTYRNDTGTLLAGQGSQIDGYGQAAQGQVSSFLGQLQGGADTALIQADTAGQAFRDGIVNAADSGSWVLPMDPAGTPGPAQGLINSFGSLNPFDYANRLGPSDAMDDVSRRVTEAAEALSRDSTGGADALNVRSTLASANTLLTDRSGTAITTAESRIGDAFGRYSAGLLDSTGLAGELQGQVAGMAATQTVDFDTYRSTVAQAAETFRRDGVSALANAVQGTMTGLADSLDQGAAQYRSDTGVLTGDYETAAQFEIDLVDDAVQAGIEAVKEAGENGEPFEFSELTTDGPGVHLYFDPPVAAGYDFEVASGPSFASVALPDVGDGLFDLYLWDAVAGDYAFEATLEDGVTFTFDPGGVEMFRVLGIEPDAELAPGDPFAFVTALTFVSALNGASIIQTPIVVQYDPTPPNPAPAPGTLALLGLGLVGLAWARRGKGRQAPK